MRFFYSILLWILLPFFLLHLWWRGRKEPSYRQYISERFGFYLQFNKFIVQQSLIIWVHTVSLGETHAIEPLIKNLLQIYPKYIILLTHTTATGRIAGQKLLKKYKKRIIQSFFPYDMRWICARFLLYFKPKISILMETEVWPNMIEQCVYHHVPIILINARLSERSFRKGKYIKPLLFCSIKNINYIAAQSFVDARRFRLLGASNIFVTGNLKFDVKISTEMIDYGNQLRYFFGKRKIFLCASTRAGEEKLIIDALRNISQRDFLTIIVPRHPHRFEEVAVLIKTQGFSMERRSTMGKKIAKNTEIFLGDSIGEMFAYYIACDIAFIGGSLLPFGGQNLIEACSLSKPVLIGPYMFNFQKISVEALKNNAVLRVRNVINMFDVVKILFANNAYQTLLANNAQKFVLQHKGATMRTISLIQTLLY